MNYIFFTKFKSINSFGNFEKMLIICLEKPLEQLIFTKIKHHMFYLFFAVVDEQWRISSERRLLNSEGGGGTRDGKTHKTFATKFLLSINEIICLSLSFWFCFLLNNYSIGISNCFKTKRVLLNPPPLPYAL